MNSIKEVLRSKKAAEDYIDIVKIRLELTILRYGSFLQIDRQ